MENLLNLCHVLPIDSVSFTYPTDLIDIHGIPRPQWAICIRQDNPCQTMGRSTGHDVNCCTVGVTHFEKCLIFVWCKIWGYHGGVIFTDATTQNKTKILEYGLLRFVVRLELTDVSELLVASIIRVIVVRRYPSSYSKSWEPRISPLYTTVIRRTCI